MATTFFCNKSRSATGPARVYDLSTSTNSDPTGYTMNFVLVNGGTEILPTDAGFSAGINGFMSERAASTQTVSGQIKFDHWGTEGSTSNDITYRFRLLKLLRGGAGTEELIADFDGPSEVPTAATALSWTFTLPTFTLSVDERLIVRILAIPAPGLTMTAGNGVMSYNSPSVAQQQVKVTFLDTTLSLKANYTKLFIHNAGTTGIGTFWDLLSTSDSGTVTVNTVGSGTEVQWTNGGGGAAVSWLSPRFASNWYCDNAEASIGAAALHISNVLVESANQANCGWRAKVWRYRDGVETLVLSVDDTVELTTSNSQRTINSYTSGASFTPTEFLEDDRLVLRLYLIPSAGQIMGSGRTVSMILGVQTQLQILEGVPVKAEGDPAASWTVPDGMSMMGLGN
jgi:hypothetical protein